MVANVNIVNCKRQTTKVFETFVVSIQNIKLILSKYLGVQSSLCIKAEL